MKSEPPDPQAICARVERAIEAAGADAMLVGYDANGIQELVTATNRPKVISGASASVKTFDEEVQRHFRGCIFAGGGRGLLLLPVADASSAESWLREGYDAKTYGGILGVAKAPFRRTDEGASVKLFRRAQLNSKDEAPPPARAWLPQLGEHGVCHDCWEREARHRRAGDDADRYVCERCHRFWESQHGDRTLSNSLSELAADDHELNAFAVVSADGNDMGPFFARLESLKAIACASALVEWIFGGALEEALVAAGVPKEGRVIAATGGDDLRIFVDPRRLPELVSALFESVHDRSKCGPRYHTLLGPAAAAQLEKVGVGMGALVVDDHFPAGWAQDRAHDLEISAKKRCKEYQARSAVDFLVVTSGDELTQGVARQPRPTTAHGDELEQGVARQAALTPEEWSSLLSQARALSHVPRSQRAQMVEARRTPPVEEADNLFRYQLARSEKWRKFVEEAGGDWRDRDRCVRFMPDERLAALASLLEAAERRSATRRSP